jgi:hypothetical protein
MTVQNLVAEFFDAVYPVGAIYMGVTNVAPKIGTWVAWGSGRVPVGVNSTDTDFATVEKTGGDKTQILTAAIGAVNANSNVLGYVATSSYWAAADILYTLAAASSTATKPTSVQHGSRVYRASGTKLDPSLVQPYITCYMFKRTA